MAFTVDEVNVIKKLNSTNHSSLSIAKALNRTQAEIATMLDELGLKDKHNDDKPTKRAYHRLTDYQKRKSQDTSMQE